MNRKQNQTDSATGWVELQQLEQALDSPLRIKLVANMLTQFPGYVTLRDAVIDTGSHVQDVENCLGLLVRWNVVEVEAQGQAHRINFDLPTRLLTVLESAVQAKSADLERERQVRFELFAGMIGVDPKMQLVFELVRQVARLDVPVLITGESGTGKELVARAIHGLSLHRKGGFGAVNCATLTESLFESEVFGHARGAFTGANKEHSGLIEQCNDGSLFLDEIGELSLMNQAKLLRVLQDGIFNRVGDPKPRQSNFRLISATNRELSAMIEDGSFREDLFYRLNVFPIRVPSLRERAADVPFLVDGLLSKKAKQLFSGDPSKGVTEKAMKRLSEYHWPGNVRELENVIVRAAIMAQGEPIDERHLPPLRRPSVVATTKAKALSFVLKPLAEMERAHIQAVLNAKDWNIQASAHILGISRTTLYKKIREHDIENPKAGLS